MTDQLDWKPEYEREIRRGIAARDEGNEGMARVCARRAAGVLVRAHFDRGGRKPNGMSVINLLRALRDSDDGPEKVRELASYFILQITEDHVLPGDIDLIAEAERLQAALFPDEPESKK
jgi:HEPN domain-containing protein